MRISLDDENDALTIHQMIVQHGGKIVSFTWVKESLEDIFFRLVKVRMPDAISMGDCSFRNKRMPQK